MINFFYFLNLSAARANQFGFQIPATPIAEGCNELHNYIVIILILVCSFVLWMIYIIVSEFNIINYKTINNKIKITDHIYNHVKSIHLTHGAALEIFWTIIPTIILITIALPSFALLYAMDEVVQPELTIKIIGHQWYWAYEFSDLVQITKSDKRFDSYMIPEEDLKFGTFRLLETDRSLWLPEKTHIRLIITAGDVLHCWAVPSLGVKMDAVPGRLNQASLFIKRQGLFFGQCSELCGVNHGFMPIVVKSVDYVNFLLHLHSNDEFRAIVKASSSAFQEMFEVKLMLWVLTRPWDKMPLTIEAEQAIKDGKSDKFTEYLKKIFHLKNI